MKNNFWGLSSGIFMGHPSDESYSIKTNISNLDTTYTFVNENPGNIELGFNTLIRRGWKISGCDNTLWHVGFGPGLTVTNKVKPRFLLGTGIGFGEDHSFLIDIGIIAGYYDVLSNVYANEDIENLHVLPSSYLVSKLRSGFYFSISYLFIK